MIIFGFFCVFFMFFVFFCYLGRPMFPMVVCWWGCRVMRIICTVSKWTRTCTCSLRNWLSEFVCVYGCVIVEDQYIIGTFSKKHVVLCSCFICLLCRWFCEEEEPVNFGQRKWLNWWVIFSTYAIKDKWATIRLRRVAGLFLGKVMVKLVSCLKYFHKRTIFFKPVEVLKKK